MNWWTTRRPLLSPSVHGGMANGHGVWRWLPSKTGFAAWVCGGIVMLWFAYNCWAIIEGRLGFNNRESHELHTRGVEEKALASITELKNLLRPVLASAASSSWFIKRPSSCPSVKERGVMGLPLYVYGDAMADRSPSNVRDLARSAALDRYELNITKGHTWGSFVKQLKVQGSGSTGASAAVPASPSSTASSSTENSAPREGEGRLRRVIATHHKTGTALMHDIFKTISKEFGYKFLDVREVEDRPWTLNSTYPDARTNPTGYDIVLDYHLGKKLPEFMATGMSEDERRCQSLPVLYQPYKMVHLVRNPVDVLVSGFLYHRRNPEDEQWLFEPVKELGGQTYAEHLKTAGPEAAMMAELGMADDELRMLALAHRDVERDAHAVNVQVEKFFDDFDGTVGAMLRFLEFPEDDIERMVKAVAVADMRRWSEEELKSNEHFTQKEDRSPFKAVITMPGFLNKTTSYMRYAMGYDDTFPMFQH